MGIFARSWNAITKDLEAINSLAVPTGFTLGDIVVGDDNMLYQLVKMTGGAAANGNVLAFVEGTRHNVELSDSDNSAVNYAGVAIGVITQNYYGWVQKCGKKALVTKVSAGAISAGAALKLSATAGALEVATVGLDHVVALADADAASGVATITAIFEMALFG